MVLFDILLSSSGAGSLISGVLEGLGIPWPGALVVAAAGTKYSGFWGAVMVATLFSVAYTLGSLAQYAVGRFCRGFLERFLSAKMRRKLDEAMAKYGQAAVLWTRPLAVGNYISIPAGMMRMNPTKFSVYTFLGIWPWAFGMAAFGSLLSRWLSYATEAVPFLVAIVTAYIVFVTVRRLWQRTAARSASTFSD